MRPTPSRNVRSNILRDRPIELIGDKALIEQTSLLPLVILVVMSRKVQENADQPNVVIYD